MCECNGRNCDMASLPWGYHMMKNVRRVTVDKVMRVEFLKMRVGREMLTQSTLNFDNSNKLNWLQSWEVHYS